MVKNLHSPTMQRMKSLADRWEQEDDQRAVFLQCYSMMTENMLEALDDGRFHDAKWVGGLLSHFAEYYFAALDSFEAPGLQSSAVWQYAHSAAIGENAMVLQNLLLGVNAHINYDLVLALADILDPEWLQLGQDGRQNRYEDYCLVNDIIGETIDEVQDQVLEHHEPALDIVDKLLGPMDEMVTRHVITAWRGEVWDNTVQMLNLGSLADREELRLKIENASMQKAEFILHGPKLEI